MRKYLFLILSFASTSLLATQRGIDSIASSAFASAASVSWTHVLGTCANSVLIVSCGNDAGTFSSIRFAGISLTQQVHLTSTETADIWTLSGSTKTGSGTIIATNSAALNCACASVSFCGADRNNPNDASATQQSTQVDPNIAVTVVSSGAWAVDSMYKNGTAIPEPYSVPGAVIRNLSGTGTTIAHIVGPLQAGSNTLSWKEPVSGAWTKAVMSIKPSTGTPIVTTQVATGIDQTSATGNGTLLYDGGFSVSAVGVCISSTNATPTTSDTCVTGSGTPFMASFSGLLKGTKYYARAYATNSEGTDYGSMIPFVTPTDTARRVLPGTGSSTTH